jgi:CheY-like chemotaxis protein
MESIGRLAGGVAHDFNNDLTVINGYCGLLLKVLPAGSREHNFAGEALAAGERAASLTQQLLAFSRKQIMEPRVISPAQVIQSLHSMLRRLLREDIDLVLSLAPDTGPILCDPSQLEQIVVNLVVNARDAVPSGGVILIESSNVSIKGENGEPAQSVMIRITDNGTGMDEATLSRIFEPFFTTKDLGRGVGLGLAVVHGIVAQSGGTIRIESKPGAGTTCTMFFPRAQSIATQEGTSIGAAGAGTSGNGSVLLVEDRDDVRQLTTSIFEDAGYVVTGCCDGLDAVNLIGSTGANYDLLVTDIVMPRMNGRELAEWLRQRHPRIKVLYVSGYAPDTVGHEGLLDPSVHFLPKPYSAAQLVSKAREILSAGSSAASV